MIKKKKTKQNYYIILKKKSNDVVTNNFTSITRNRGYKIINKYANNNTENSN